MNALTPAHAAVALILISLFSNPGAARMAVPQPGIPLKSGNYVFQHRYAEQDQADRDQEQQDSHGEKVMAKAYAPGAARWR